MKNAFQNLKRISGIGFLVEDRFSGVLANKRRVLFAKAVGLKNLDNTLVCLGSRNDAADDDTLFRIRPHLTKRDFS